MEGTSRIEKYFDKIWVKRSNESIKDNFSKLCCTYEKDTIEPIARKKSAEKRKFRKRVILPFGEEFIGFVVDVTDI